VVADEEVVMVFDYPDFDALSCVGLSFQEVDIRRYIDSEKRVLLFSSHSHPDHFNPKIKDVTREISNSKLILSDGVLGLFPDYTKDIENKCHLLKPGDCIDIEDTKITAMPSTDIGISLFIEHKGIHIFFPGDLALWLWEGIEEDTKGEIREIFNGIIQEIKKRRTDILFVVAEPNLREIGWGGAVEAVKSIKPALTIPIHLYQQVSWIYKFKQALPPGMDVFSYRRTGDYCDWKKK
jgi:L-ascorbate metabolism protein UlaG (beta-lactamase superfamily)